MMYLTFRSALVRHLAVAVVNGAIAYVIRIIAPLSLMAVILNTLWITVASYFTASTADRVVAYFQCDRHCASFRDPRYPMEDSAIALDDALQYSSFTDVERR